MLSAFGVYILAFKEVLGTIMIAHIYAKTCQRITLHGPVTNGV